MKERVMVILIVGMLLAIAEIVHAQPIVISGFRDPYSVIAEKVMTEAYRRLGRTMEVEYFPAERAIQTANNGEVDGELYRKEGMEQTFPNLIRIPVVVSTAEFVVFTKDKPFSVEGWPSLRPYKVGYVRGIKVIEMNLANGTQAEAVATVEQAFKKLDAGRSDLVIAARVSGLASLRELGLTGIVILEPPLVKIASFHYLHVKNQQLVEPLTATLQQMEKEGVMQHIQQQVEQDFLFPSKGANR